MNAASTFRLAVPTENDSYQITGDFNPKQGYHYHTRALAERMAERCERSMYDEVFVVEVLAPSVVAALAEIELHDAHVSEWVKDQLDCYNDIPF